MSFRFLNRITIQHPIAPLMDREIHYADKVYRRIVERPFATRNLLLDGTNKNMALKMDFLSSVEMFFGFLRMF
jgi:hypothetical protein